MMRSGLASVFVLAATIAGADTHENHALAGIALAGCAAVVAPDVCELPLGEERALHLWIPASNARELRALVTVGGVAVAKASTEVAPDGLKLTIPLRLTTTSVPLVLRLDAEVALRVTLHPTARWAWQAQIERSSNRETRALLSARLERAQGAERSKLLRVLADAETALGNADGAAQLLREGARVATLNQRYSEARSHWLRLAYHRAQAHDFATSAHALASARDVPSLAHFLDADGEAALAYVAATSAFALRDLRAADRAYLDAEAWVDRGAALMGPQIIVGRAQLAEQQGRLDFAQELLARALKTELASVHPCFRALATSRLGLYELESALRAGARRDALLRARERLEAAAALYASACQRVTPEESGSAQLYLGFAALALGDLAAARQHRERAGSLQGFPRSQLRSSLLEAEILRAEGQVEPAEAAFVRLAVESERRLSLDLAWSAREAAGRAAEARGALQAAAEHYERAESLLAMSHQWIPLDNGVLGFLSDHGQSAEGLARVWLRLGREAEAFAALRRARRRALDGLARSAASPPLSADWQRTLGAYAIARERVEQLATKVDTCPLPERELHERELTAARAAAERELDSLVVLARNNARRDQSEPLREPEPAEALLLWRELGGRWHGFLALGSELHHVVAAAMPRHEAWLAPFESWLQRAARLSVLFDGPLADVELHTIAARRFPALLVAYSLDLPARARRGGERGSTVLAGDALGDLPEARRELALIAERLARRGEATQRLVGREITLRALQGAAAAASRLHYAGHARFAGLDGWQSQLPIANAEVTAGDILSWPGVPAEVILSACEAAREPGLPHAVGLGLAQAFLLRGARTVIAPSRPISDAASRRFAAALWDGISSTGTLEAAYQRALAAMGGDEQASVFRLLSE